MNLYMVAIHLISYVIQRNLHIRSRKISLQSGNCTECTECTLFTRHERSVSGQFDDLNILKWTHNLADRTGATEFKRNYLPTCLYLLQKERRALPSREQCCGVHLSDIFIQLSIKYLRNM